ncbi:uncharacterized protein C16orf46 homolog [Hemitrygon akajei]|uniref:uncharacterized protein C16orf46 homolog n=1 Tax=Hemitrygon akajei TaxID=2704970 RepID=UPI003BF9D65B
MEFQEKDVLGSKASLVFESPGSDSNDGNVVMSPTHFLHSWESERKLIDVLITLSEEDEKPMDQFILCGGWDDAVHGWRTNNLRSSIPTLKTTKRPRKEERNGNHCVVCAEMVPILERKMGQDIEHSKRSSSTTAYNFIGENSKSSPKRTTPAFSQTRIPVYSSTISQAQVNEASKEVYIQDVTESEIDPHKEKEGEVILSTNHQGPVRKHSPLFPPVKMANGSEKFALGIKPVATFSLGTLNGNESQKIVSETLEKRHNSANCCLRTHCYNMAMLQVSELEKTAISPPVGITRIMDHWCWRYSLMQDKLAVSHIPASKLMECHSIRLQPSKIMKHHTKNIKQDNTGKSAFSHSDSTHKIASRIRQKDTCHNILPMLSQPDPSPSSGPGIAISILPQRLL